MVAEADVSGKEAAALIFTYGTLKRNFSNHPLLQDLILNGDASFIGTYRTVQNYPLVCGPYRVPFLLNIPGSGQSVHGELYSVSADGLSRMDELEGTSRGHYERLPIKVVPSGEEEMEAKITCAEAYYAHGSYAMEMWNKNGKQGFKCYTEKETIGLFADQPGACNWVIGTKMEAMALSLRFQKGDDCWSNYDEQQLSVRVNFAATA